jgi:hypothetical protein
LSKQSQGHSQDLKLFWRSDKGGSVGPEHGALRRVGGVLEGSSSQALESVVSPPKICQVHYPNLGILVRICDRIVVILMPVKLVKKKLTSESWGGGQLPQSLFLQTVVYYTVQYYTIDYNAARPEIRRRSYTNYSRCSLEYGAYS